MGISRFVGAFTNARFSPLLRFNHKSWTALDECFDQLTWGSLLLCLDLQVWRTRSVESPSGLMVISICLGQSITMVLSSKSVSFGRYVSLNMDDSIKGYGSSPLVCLDHFQGVLSPCRSRSRDMVLLWFKSHSIALVRTKSSDSIKLGGYSDIKCLNR